MNIWFLIFTLLNVADIITTIRAINLGGVEANPVIRWAMARIGSAWGIIIPKVLILPLIYFALLSLPVHAPYILALLCLVYILININNIKQMLRLRKN